MKSFFTYFFAILVLSVGFTAGFWYFLPHHTDTVSSLSPIPDFLTVKKNDQVKLLDLWLPFIQQTYGSGSEQPELTAKSVLMYDLTTNKTIFEKNPRERLPMASITKIMTAIISIENPRKDEKYLVRKENIVGEDSMGLESGEVLSLEELLYGLMLPSGNDAAEVLANNYYLGRDAFIQAMNDKAKALGLTDTRFSNPSGLQGDGIQFTTTYDLLVMTKYALDNYPLFAKIVSTDTHSIVPTSTHKAYELTSETNLLTTYEGVRGVKTGYTPEAGLCLVTYLDYKGHRIIGIILNSQNRRGEMKELLDYSLKSLGIEPPEYTGE